VTRHLVDERGRDGATERRREGHGKSPLPSVSPSLGLCLLARRQQLPTQPCTFFWISDCLALDGVIRSDNRGSESLFPLYLTADEHRANFAPAFVEQFAAATQLAWQPLGRGDFHTTFGPEDLLAYIYALFHSPNYRDKYAAELRGGFPRVLVARSVDQFGRMSRFGHELMDLHRLRTATSSHVDTADWEAAVHNFHAGGYLALKKWLQPKHRSTHDPEYSCIVAAIARTIEIMTQLDAELGKSP